MSKNPDDKEQTIELIEEEISIGVRSVETGKVRVDVKVNTEERLVEQILERQEVTVTRIPAPSVRILPMLLITKRMNSERRSDYSTIYTPSCRRFLRIVPQRLRILPISLILLSDLKI